MESLLESLSRVLNVLLIFFSFFGLALWLSTVIWVFRDIRARTRDIFVVLLSLLIALILPLGGALLYLLLRPRETLADQYERALEEEALLQELEQRDVCPACQEAIEEDYLICPNCSTRLKNRCPNCQRLTKLDWNVCAYCGT